jgi:hypothetical protein
LLLTEKKCLLEPVPVGIDRILKALSNAQLYCKWDNYPYGKPVAQQGLQAPEVLIPAAELASTAF